MSNREVTYFCDPQRIEIFQNPRTHTNPGFSHQRMKELRENIKKTGLKQALEVRLVNNKPRLIAGERRLRSILNLIEENVSCFNRATNKWDKASNVYAEVKCTITECDDKEAIKASVMENLLHEHLTDYEIILQCELLELAGYTRTEQAAIFDYSEAWVSQSHSLLKGNKRVLEALHSGLLGRTQALEFLKYPEDKIDDILDRAISYNKMEFEEKEKELLAHREKFYSQWEEKEAELRLAEATGNVDEAVVISQQLAEVEKETDNTEKKLAKHRQGGKKTPKPSISNIQTAAKDEAADNGVNRHLPMKMVRRMADQLTGFLESGEPLVNSETEEEYSRREVRIVRDVMDIILARSSLKNPLDALAVVDSELNVAAK